MDLRSGQSYWRHHADEPAPASAALDQAARCDVAIVGAGVTGAILADMLVGAGEDVMVIDSRDVGLGSTAASTALLMYEIDTPLTELANRYGWERAVRCYQASMRSLHALADLAHNLGEPCEFAWRKSLYLASRRSHARQLHDEFEARRRAGIAVDLLGEADIAALFPFTAPAGLLAHEAAEVDPLRMTRALLRRAVARGASVFGSTCIADIHATSTGMVLSTRGGPSVHARHVVIAAGYESGAFLDHAPGALHSTYVLCSRPLAVDPPWHERWLIWESSRPYMYLRTTSDGRVMIGGGDVPFKNAAARDALLPRRTSALVKRLGRMFPDLPFEPEYAWTGTFGESADGLPYIGTPTSRPGCIFAMGYGGNGITWAATAAEIIRDQCLGRPNPDAVLFGFQR